MDEMIRHREDPTCSKLFISSGHSMCVCLCDSWGCQTHQESENLLRKGNRTLGSDECLVFTVYCLKRIPFHSTSNQVTRLEYYSHVYN